MSGADGGWGMGDAGLVKVAASAEEAEQLVRQLAGDDWQAGVAGLHFAVACALCREGRWQEASRLVGISLPLLGCFLAHVCFLVPVSRMLANNNAIPPIVHIGVGDYCIFIYDDV